MSGKKKLLFFLLGLALAAANYYLRTWEYILYVMDPEIHKEVIYIAPDGPEVVAYEPEE